MAKISLDVALQLLGLRNDDDIWLVPNGLCEMYGFHSTVKNIYSHLVPDHVIISKIDIRRSPYDKYFHGYRLEVDSGINFGKMKPFFDNGCKTKEEN